MSELEDKARAALVAYQTTFKGQTHAIPGLFVNNALEALAPIFAEVEGSVCGEPLFIGALNSCQLRAGHDFGHKAKQAATQVPAGDVVTVDLGDERVIGLMRAHPDGLSILRSLAIEPTPDAEDWDAERKRRLAMYDVPPMSHAELHAPIEGAQAPNPLADLTARVDDLERRYDLHESNDDE